MSYPLGWSLTTRIGVRRERWPGGYEARCRPTVRVGEYVEPEQPVMSLERPEASLALAKMPQLSLPTSVPNRLPGVINGRERSQGSQIIAGLRGRIIAVTARGSVVIEGQAAIVGGTIGAGRQVAGPLTIWQAPGLAQGQDYIPPGAILVVPGPLNKAMLQRAANSGIVGIVASSVSSHDFESFLHTNLLDLLNSVNVELFLSHLPPLTVLLTEGLGTSGMPVRTIDLLNKYQGQTALLTGATSIRAGRYPELVISLPADEARKNETAPLPDMALKPGALVRVCSGSYEGAIGEINYLFSHQQVFPSGIRASAARIRLEDGSLLVVPLPVLERIG